MKWARSALAAAAAATVMVGCSGEPTATVEGELRLMAGYGSYTWDSVSANRCEGHGSVRITGGEQVTLVTAEGVERTGRLSRGRVSWPACEFTYRIDRVPESSSYTVRVGRYSETADASDTHVMDAHDVFERGSFPHIYVTEGGTESPPGR